MRSSETTYGQVYGTVIRMTPKAILFKLQIGGEVWIPQSQIFEDDLAGLDVGVVSEINVQQWFLDKEVF